MGSIPFARRASARVDLVPAQRKFQVVFDFAPRGKAQECGPDVGTSMVGAPWVAD